MSFLGLVQLFDGEAQKITSALMAKLRKSLVQYSSSIKTGI